MKLLDFLNVNFSEVNTFPTLATFQPLNPNDVRTRLAQADSIKMPTNGHSLETLREFSQIAKHDDIDRIGIATHLLSDSAAKFSKSGLYAQYMKALQTAKKN